MSVKLEQKASKLIRQNRKKFISAQLASMSLPVFAVIKDIELPMLPPAAHQHVHYVTMYLSCNAIISTMQIIIIM